MPDLGEGGHMSQFGGRENPDKPWVDLDRPDLFGSVNQGLEITGHYADRNHERGVAAPLGRLALMSRSQLTSVYYPAYDRPEIWVG